eukprot:376377_1
MSADIVDFDDELEDNDNIQEPPFKKQKFDDEIAIDEDNLYTQTLTNTNRNSLDDLSEDLIAYIASHLQLYDYINFSKCNRLIHISVTTKTISISQITFDSDQVNKYCLYIKDKPNEFKNIFTNIKSIEININNIDEFEPKLFSNIQRLRLIFEQNENHNIKLFDNMNFSNIYDLDIAAYETCLTQNILQIISKMNNIKHFSIFTSHKNFVLDPSLCKLNSLQHLNAITWSLRDANKQNITLVDTYKHQLQSLHTHGNKYYPNEKMFTQLKELCIIQYLSFHDNIEYQTFVNCEMLERIHINIDCFDQDFDKKDLKLFNDLWSIKSVNFISVYCYFFFSTTNTINTLIKALSKHQRNRMKVRISAKKIDNPTDFDKMVKLINIMDKYSENFMFILESDMQEYKALLNEKLEQKYLVNLVESEGNKRMIVSNINCNICGYVERWIYDARCEYCQGCYI